MAKRPNILFILSDDHAVNAISAYGSTINRTPNIDRLAKEGALLKHCYVTNSICTPSRAAILTGTHNHVNRVTTLDSAIDPHFPNAAKHLRAAGYQTAMIGKWHQGEPGWHLKPEGEVVGPTGFDYYSVFPCQGEYHDPLFIQNGKQRELQGYASDLVSSQCIEWLDSRDPDKPFFLMCQHKAPHRAWDPKPEHRNLYHDPVPLPETFDDTYHNRARAAGLAKMRIADDLTYDDLDLIQLPEDGGSRMPWRGPIRRIPVPENLEGFHLRCALTGETFTFRTQEELFNFKYQRYMHKYLQCVHSLDENVGRMLDYLDEHGLAEDTLVIYSSDQGFFLGEHGWFDKRFIYEESLQMPMLVRYPREIQPGTVNTDMTCNVDFAATWLDYAGIPAPSYMQGRSFRANLRGEAPSDWPDLVYHRYWMNRDYCTNALAHYGIRTHRYKLVYWYDDDLGQPGSSPGEGVTDWELFDLEKDPREMHNCYDEPAYADVVREMTAKLNAEMQRIGDIPEHPVPAGEGTS